MLLSIQVRIRFEVNVFMELHAFDDETYQKAQSSDCASVNTKFAT